MYKKRKIKFTNKRHSRFGIISVALGGAALLILMIVFAAAYLAGGAAGKYIAVLGFLALLLCLAGFCYGIRGKREEDVYALFPNLGCGLNIILLAAFGMIYMLGW